jgi:hypothetical protein
MTRYTVVYSTDVMNELAEIWLNHSDARGAITGASHTLDQALAENGASKGIQVGVRLREFTASPLTVYFVASRPDRIVRIVRVLFTRNP